jgi:Flp pilus assembly pilin Flp
MNKRLDQFKSDRDGAVTTDYVMLAAALIAMTLSGMQAIKAGAFDGIANILGVVEQAGGCTTTSESGTTDISKCD